MNLNIISVRNHYYNSSGHNKPAQHNLNRQIYVSSWFKYYKSHMPASEVQCQYAKVLKLYQWRKPSSFHCGCTSNSTSWMGWMILFLWNISQAVKATCQLSDTDHSCLKENCVNGKGFCTWSNSDKACHFHFQVFYFHFQASASAFKIYFHFCACCFQMQFLFKRKNTVPPLQ